MHVHGKLCFLEQPGLVSFYIMDPVANVPAAGFAPSFSLRQKQIIHEKVGSPLVKMDFCVLPLAIHLRGVEH